MGRKTQIIVIKENNKGEVKKTVWHHQWGFGRNMYFALMSLFIADYSKDTSNENYDFLNTSFPIIPKLYNVTDEIPADVLEGADIANLASIKCVFDYCDNNNGGLVIYMKENKRYYNPAHITIGFLMGYKDEYYKSIGDNKYYNKKNIGEKPFMRWLTPEEYGRINGGSNFSDDDFIEIIYHFCNYFKIKTFKNKKTPEQVEKAYKNLLNQEKEVK